MRVLTTCFLLSLAPAWVGAAPRCGGDWQAFLQDVGREAVAEGRSAAATGAFLAQLQPDPAVLAADRRQGVFQLDFTRFSNRLISENRARRGAEMGRKWDAVFTRIEAQYGIPRGVLLAFWAFETDYGAFQGDFNTANALATLAHDCRRPALFRPQLLAAITLFERGDFDPATTTGAWAGEIGMVQMLPQDILDNGVDGDGDGHVTLKTSAPDALMSAARMLSRLGWKPDQPWLQEVRLPARMDWGKSGYETQLSVAEWAAMGVQPRSGTWAAQGQASLILPQGHKGPAFLAYPNFHVYFDWNQSFTYVLTAAYFATRMGGAPAFDPRAPEPGLEPAQMKALQRKLAARGHDVGGIDGILGAGTRAAVQKEQARLGLPADAWPTKALLDRL